jgi:hypothetical protein
MKENRFIFLLAGWILAMGIAGFIRTGASMPIILNGSIAIITAILGFWLLNKGKPAYFTTLVWLSIGCLVYGYMAIFGVSAHQNPTFGTYFIFSSMAIFCLLTIVKLLTKKPV